ncbi:DUF805 domain-containing protein [Caenispirillum bisanense]|uniref:DUF805 domain-containing protein n=1 Tax=Caenispirillum bisanense TaxID=414052 RepID=UPI0031E1CD59
MQWYVRVLKNYAQFNGRALRSEYWFFVLFNIIVSIILAVVDSVTGTYSDGAGLGLLGGLYTLAVIIPSLAVGVRRLHDVDKSGWWLLIAFIPVLGILVLLYFMVIKGSEGDNRFGPPAPTEP